MPTHVSTRGACSRLLGVATACIITACGPDARVSTGDAVRRDSGSVHVVENGSALWGDDARWSVDRTPSFALAAADSASDMHDFQRLLQVYRLADGTVAVLDMGEPFVRAFDAKGGLLWSAGRRGDGPGEIRDPALLSRIRGDTLIVEDSRTPRSLLISPRGNLLGTLPSRLVAAPGGGTGDRMLYPAVRLRDGSLLAYTPVMRREEMEGVGIVVPKWPVYLMSRSGDSVSALGDWPLITAAQLSAPSVHVVFGARAVLSQTPEGFLYGFPTTSELRMFDASGVVRTVLRTPGTRRAAEGGEIAAARAQLAQAMKDPGRAALRADEILVDSIPAYGRAIVGTDGVIWRERFDPAAPPPASGLARLDRGAIWDVHDTSGIWLGGVQLPPGFFLTDAGTDWVAGIHSDSGDAQSPVVHALRRR